MQKNFNLELDFVGKVLKMFDVGVEEICVGVVVFSDKIKCVFDFKEGVLKDVVLECVKNIMWGKGNMFMDKVFGKMREGFFKENGGCFGQVF